MAKYYDTYLFEATFLSFYFATNRKCCIFVPTKTSKSPAQDDKLCNKAMAHLSIGKNTSYNKLVELTGKYLGELSGASDIFEREEINGYLNDLYSFCCLNRGMQYWQRVLTAAKQL